MTKRRILRGLLLLAVCLPAGVLHASNLSLLTTYTGEFVSDQFGIATAGIGDVNGDHFADLLIGANVNDQAATSGGKVYLYPGGAQLPTTYQASFAGDVERGYVGGAVAGGADLNGDGYDDWVTGAPGVGPDGTLPGRVYVFLGGPAFDTVPDLVLDGTVPGGQFGQAVCLIPDFNGDGYADLAVGAPRAGDGTVNIFLGGPSGPVATPAVILHARSDDRRFGKSLAAVPDQDDDDLSELLVGAPYSSEAAVWAGAAVMYLGSAELDTLPDLVLLGTLAGDQFGSCLSCAGDADGDGQNDILVGAPFANPGGLVDAGTAYLFTAGTVLDTVADMQFNGSATEERLGAAVSLGFDWDDDGYGDLALGVPDREVDGLSYAGQVEIHCGGPGLDTLPDTLISGPTASTHLGTTVTATGDMKGNGRPGLAVGGYNSGNNGRVMVFGTGDPSLSSVPGVARGGSLRAPWPNPANPGVNFRLVTDAPGRWILRVIDLRGRVAATIWDGHLSEGVHDFRWQGRDTADRPASSGRYLLQATGEQQVLSRSLTLVR